MGSLYDKLPISKANCDPYTNLPDIICYQKYYGLVLLFIHINCIKKFLI